MGDRPRDGAPLTIRPGTPADAPFIIALGTEAFARFGEYAPIMEGFVLNPVVGSFIAWSAGERVGFALVEAPAEYPGLADLVAIAVARGHRRTGVGRALLRRVIETREAHGTPSVLVLTVADDNAPAIALFQETGFTMIPGSEGRYARGQISRRMVRAI